ncbi:MAG TPA: helix-turn-helix domain-containing protein [Clostridia bacterium]
MIKRKCFMCGADMEEKTISTKAGWGKYTLTIDGINAYVCPECGETTYSSEEVHMLQELGRSLASLGAEERPDLLNISEVADLLRVSNQTVYNMIRDGRLCAIKIGREWRFMRKSIESILHPDDSFKVAARSFNGENLEDDKEIILQHLSKM